MPTNFTPTSIVKSASRNFTVSIISAATFDANIAALKAVDNPLGATVAGVAVASEYYKVTISYLSPVGEVLGSITIAAPTRDIYDAVVAEILAATARTIHYGAGTIADREAVKHNWNVRLKIHDPTGEIYYLNFTRKDLKISSYENDAILTKVDTWADGITSLN